MNLEKIVHEFYIFVDLNRLSTSTCEFLKILSLLVLCFRISLFTFRFYCLLHLVQSIPNFVFQFSLISLFYWLFLKLEALFYVICLNGNQQQNINYCSIAVTALKYNKFQHIIWKGKKKIFFHIFILSASQLYFI